MAAGLKDTMKSYLTDLYRRGSSLTEMEKEVERRVSDIDLRFDDMRERVEEITQQRVSCLIHTHPSMVHTRIFPLSSQSSTPIFATIPFYLSYPPADNVEWKHVSDVHICCSH